MEAAVRTIEMILARPIALPHGDTCCFRIFLQQNVSAVTRQTVGGKEKTFPAPVAAKSASDRLAALQSNRVFPAIMNGFLIAGKIIAFARIGRPDQALSMRCALTRPALEPLGSIGQPRSQQSSHYIICIKRGQGPSFGVFNERRSIDWMAIDSWAKARAGGSLNWRHRGLAFRKWAKRYQDQHGRQSHAPCADIHQHIGIEAIIDQPAQ